MKKKNLIAYLEDYIADDLDYESIYSKADLRKAILDELIPSLENFGITAFSQLTPEQQILVDKIVDDEWDSISSSRND